MSTATDRTMFGLLKRANHLRKQIARMTEELASIPSFANPVDKGTFDPKDITAGLKGIVIGFGECPSVEPIEFTTGYIRRYHNELLTADVDVSFSGIDLVAYGIAPDNDGLYQEGFAAFPDTAEGRKKAEDFLYRIERYLGDDGQPIYPNARQAIELLVAYAREKEAGYTAGRHYLEEELARMRRRSDDLV